jgi:hypothetical protein
MAKCKIIWSKKASIKLFEILDFYTNRNKSTQYSTKLYKKILKELSLLNKYPDIGVTTDFVNVRGLIVDSFIIFYEITPENILVHTVWDCRQNPNELTIK